MTCCHQELYLDMVSWWDLSGLYAKTQRVCCLLQKRCIISADLHVHNKPHA